MNSVLVWRKSTPRQPAGPSINSVPPPDVLDAVSVSVFGQSEDRNLLKSAPNRGGRGIARNAEDMRWHLTAHDQIIGSDLLRQRLDFDRRFDTAPQAWAFKVTSTFAAPPRSRQPFIASASG